MPESGSRPVPSITLHTRSSPATERTMSSLHFSRSLTGSSCPLSTRMATPIPGRPIACGARTVNRLLYVSAAVLTLTEASITTGMAQRIQSRILVASLSRALRPSKPSRPKPWLAGSATRPSTTMLTLWASSICTHTHSRSCILIHTHATTALRTWRTCKKSPPVYPKLCVSRADATINLPLLAKAMSVISLQVTVKYSLASRLAVAASSTGSTTT